MFEFTVHLEFNLENEEDKILNIFDQIVDFISEQKCCFGGVCAKMKIHGRVSGCKLNLETGLCICGKNIVEVNEDIRQKCTNFLQKFETQKVYVSDLYSEDEDDICPLCIK